MSSRRRIPASRAIIDGPTAIAQGDDNPCAWCRCAISIMFSEVKSEGLISLRLIALFDGFADARSVTLYLPPEHMNSLNASCIDANEIPHSIKAQLDLNSPVRSRHEVISLSLAMNTPGYVAVPRTASNLSPSDNHRLQVLAFQSLCRSTKLTIYLRKNRLNESHLISLQNFANLINAKKVTSRPPDFGRMYDGEGGCKATWDIFNVPENPPHYTQQPQRTNKRPRDGSKATQTLPPLKRFTRSSKTADCTEVLNTDSETDFSNVVSSPQSTVSSADPEANTNTQFQAKAKAALLSDQDFLRSAVREAVQDTIQNVIHNELRALLPEILRTTVRETIREALHEAMPVLSSESRRNDTSGTAHGVAHDMITGTIESIVHQHLAHYVRDYLDEGPLDDMRYSVELEFKEGIEFALLDLKELKEECTKEIKDAETAALERLRDVDWDCDEIRGLTPSRCSTQERMASVKDTAEGQLRASENGQERREQAGDDQDYTETTNGTESDVMSIPDAQRVEKVISPPSAATATGSPRSVPSLSERSNMEKNEHAAVNDPRSQESTASGSIAKSNSWLDRVERKAAGQSSYAIYLGNEENGMICLDMTPTEPDTETESVNGQKPEENKLNQIEEELCAHV